MDLSTSIFSDILGRTTGLERPAILGPQACNHGRLLQEAEEIAARLQQHGARSGRVLAVALPHGREHVATLLGVRRTGAVLVPLNPRASIPEKTYILSNSGAEFLLVLGSDAALTEQVKAERVEALGEMALYRLPAASGADVQAQDCLIIYTSGSTGHPKGVVLSEHAISANVRAVSDYLALAPGDRSIVFTPPSWAYALNQLLIHIWVGGAVMPWQNGLLQPEEMLRTASELAITGVQANPTIFEMLLPDTGGPEILLPSVRYVMSAGQPLTSTLARRIQRRFPFARIANVYGCTENAPRVSYNWLPDIIPERSTPWPVGLPIDGTRIRIDAPAGETGEVLVGGASLMRCYLGAARESATRIEDGWFRTRDLGFIDDAGALNIVGRIDNVFGVGHEKVSPEEVEEVICAVAGVREAAVASVPHPILLNVPAVLVATDGEFPAVAQRIRSACTQSLSRSKFPRHIFHVEALPRTGNGKLDRVRVRAEVLRLFGQKAESAA
jgi:long-chain acyl-CoA synthetase